MTSADLLAEAETFAAQLTATVQGVVGEDCEEFRALIVRQPQREVVSVRQEPETGIALLVEGAPLLTLTAQYRCVWDSPGHFLAVEQSNFKVYSGSKAKGEPLLRYEYLRTPTGDLPGAHFHMHGHRDALAFVMTRCGSSTVRAARRADRAGGGDTPPQMSELHLPLGGSRFRPCLEDLLDMLVRELGVDAQDGWREALEEGRERWRLNQVRTVVRDAPAEAVRTLESLGYQVSWAGDGDAPNGLSSRLREL